MTLDTKINDWWNRQKNNENKHFSDRIARIELVTETGEIALLDLKCVDVNVQNLHSMQTTSVNLTGIADSFNTDFSDMVKRISEIEKMFPKSPTSSDLSTKQLCDFLVEIGWIEFPKIPTLNTCRVFKYFDPFGKTVEAVMIPEDRDCSYFNEIMSLSIDKICRIHMKSFESIKNILYERIIKNWYCSTLKIDTKRDDIK